MLSKKMEFNIFKGKIPYFIRNNEEIEKSKFETKLFMVWLVIIICFIYVEPMYTFLFYLIPLQIAWTLNFLMALPEHYGCIEGGDKFNNTRSFYNLNPIMKYFYWNSNYHAEHHIHPKVPFYALEEMSKSTYSKVKNKGSSYIMFHVNVVRNLPIMRIKPQISVEDNRVLDFNYETYEAKDENYMGR